jgi:hypothetical protein
MGFIERIENYDAIRDTIVRVGYKQSYTELKYRVIPTKGKIIGYNYNLENFIVFNPDNSFNERNTSASFNMQFRSTENLNFGINNSEVQLQFPISFTGATPLPIGHYLYSDAEISYRSDFRKNIGFTLNGGYGQFYNGMRTNLRAGIFIRDLPHVNLNFNVQYNKISFPDPYGSAEIFLITQRTEINFTTNLFWTTFFQYNTQRNNFNINSRLQYRFKPMSDLFVVYTDNYFTDPLFKSKNRAIVLKLNYWLNL